MKNNKIIRAADYLTEPKDGDLESFEMPQSDMILMGIFGDTPDYSNPKFEKIWQEFFDSKNEETISYCFEKGVDVTGTDNEPVPGFRDIAVMLRAIDSGLLTLNIDDTDGDEGLLDTEVEHYG